MIYTVTFSPALDYTMWFDQIKAGELNRALKTSFRPGGKGINVSAVLKNLGFDSVCLGFAAGFAGREILSQMNRLGLRQEFIWLEEGCSRINVKVKAREETELNASGPPITNQALTALRERIGRLKKEDILVISGNPPMGTKETIYRDFMRGIAGRGIRAAVDASGGFLLQALSEKPFFIKPNLFELEGLERRKLATEEEIAEAAWGLRSKGAEYVLVSLGENGAMLASPEGVYVCSVPPGTLVDSTGAGDSMVAAFLVKQAAGYTAEECLRYCVACGSASAYSHELADGAGAARMYACTPKARKIR